MAEYVCEGCGEPYPSPVARTSCEDQHDDEDRQERRRGRR